LSFLSDTLAFLDRSYFLTHFAFSSVRKDTTDRLAIVILDTRDRKLCFPTDSLRDRLEYVPAYLFGLE
jgi:hypothetical protein